MARMLAVSVGKICIQRPPAAMCRQPECLTKTIEKRPAACSRAQYSVRVEAGLGCKQSCHLPVKKELPVSQSCEGVKVCGLRAQLFYSMLDSKTLEDI